MAGGGRRGCLVHLPSLLQGARFIGAELSKRFSIPYVTCEASYARKRDIGEWRNLQAFLKKHLSQAALNIYYRTGPRGAGADRQSAAFGRTEAFHRRARPKPGLRHAIGRSGRVHHRRHDAGRRQVPQLPDAGSFAQPSPEFVPRLDHYRRRPCSAACKELFRAVPGDRIRWMGMLPAEAIPAELRKAHLYLWPGFGEAYGMAYPPRPPVCLSSRRTWRARPGC